tara:strand:- start:281 stop:1156 length:876 start_codon:yes stop_codon:yes gene_type:complete
MDFILDNKEVPYSYKKPFEYSVDLHLTNMCNLSCVGCDHYSNYKIDGYLSLEDCESYLKSWGDKFNKLKLELRLLGGEPTLNKNLVEIIEITRSYIPNNNIVLITNGFYIDRHDDIKNVLIDNKIVLKLSYHSHDKEYVDKITPIREMLLDWSSDGLNYRSFDYTNYWNKLYRGHGNNMRPYEDNNPRKSWESCGQTWFDGIQCLQLYNNKLWKCPPITYLSDVLDKNGIQNHPSWKKYLKYEPLSSNVSLKEMVNWMKREEEHVCNMCPAYDDTREKVIDKDVFGKRISK